MNYMESQMNNDNIKATNSIIKASDDKTTDPKIKTNIHLYSLMLSHIEHLDANLYNFKFIGRTLNSETTEEIYMNLQMLVNDSSLVENSKYYMSKNNPQRLNLVTSFNFEEKENETNSYRIDFSIDNMDDTKYYIMQIVNAAYNSALTVYINKAIYFKIATFLYQLLANNIIDGDIFMKKINKFVAIYNDARYENIEMAKSANIKLFNIYWLNMYIVFYYLPNNTICYIHFTKEEYSKLIEEEEE